MLASTPVVAFVATADMTRARHFYGAILGLRIIEEDVYASAFDAGGTQLRVIAVRKVSPQPYTVLGWSVGDIATTVLLKQVARQFHPALVEPDVAAVAEEQAVAAPVANPEANVVADDRSRGGRQDDADDAQVVGRARVERRGDEHGFTREGDAKTLDAYKSEHSRIAKLAEETIDEAGGEEHWRVAQGDSEDLRQGTPRNRDAVVSSHHE